MKKTLKILFTILIGIIFCNTSVNALTNEEVMKQFVLQILKSTENNGWVRSDDNIKVLINNVNKSEEIVDGYTFNDLYSTVDDQSNAKKAYYYVYPCLNSTCDKEEDAKSVDETNMIKFQIQKKDESGNVYALAVNATEEKVNKIISGNNFYFAESYGPWTSNSKYKGKIDGNLIKSLLEKGSENALNMKCVYSLGGGYKYVLRYDCSTIGNYCTGDFNCEISKNDVTERNLVTKSGKYKCPTQIYYLAHYGDTITTIDKYEVLVNKDFATDKFKTSELIEEESNITEGKNACKKEQGNEDDDDEKTDYTYDFTCQYPDFYLNFNKGDAYASVQTALQKYKGLRVNLDDTTQCPPAVYVMCAEDNSTCSISQYSDHLGLSAEHKLITNSSDIPNADDLEEKNKNSTEIKFSPTKLCKDTNDCDISLTGFCALPTISRTLKFVGLLFSLAKILVPAIIIIMGIVNLIKIITSGKDDEVKKGVKNIATRILIGVVIFLLPGVIKWIFTIADDIVTQDEPSEILNCVYCVLDKDECVVTEKN